MLPLPPPNPPQLDDMRLFAAVAKAGSFTKAAQQLGLPKQTLSRRVAGLERDLDVQLLVRTTRRLVLTQVGAVFAERCAELVHLAEAAHRAVRDTHDTPRGTLRVSADPVLGEVFVAPLMVAYAQRFADVRVEAVWARRRVDLLEERFDAAFRIGRVDDPGLEATPLGPARIRWCASPDYVQQHGSPQTAEDLARHACLTLGDEAGPVRWPVPGPDGVREVPVTGRVHASSLPLVRSAALAGLGIALLPEFACHDDLEAGRLLPVLVPGGLQVGAVWLVWPAGRTVPARVRALTELAVELWEGQPPGAKRSTIDE